ncbi:uncharacterized protein MELLADRAFT_38316 [Melampsora larici-populina 98AG31]|uniref:Arsenical-resistance protein n=1 Tax=Melampsora larici-populina (strain 98AG31 / pathotype 3-4-7) TaxID=747676 RepID=F4RXE0_MELLP|nr:uncharacterized protein MELLADRAFT_38316 [Melampsora larici-populina 98AG31]EGG03002.1 hypothetical protein MELLADRAFT_38316 [Melampsora larici-populina 98AG31]
MRFGNPELWKSLSFFDRFLAVFVFLAMVLGILIGNFANEQVQRHLNGGAKWGNVSIPLLIGLLIMIWPPLSKVEWECLPRLLKSRDLWVHLTVSFVLNWLVSPFIMLSLAWVTLPESALERERVGVVLVGVARCVAMVLVWNGIAQGDRDYCAILVVSNSILQMVLFAPYALLFANILCRSPTLTTPTLHLDYGNVAQSVGIYLGIPLVAGGLTRWIVCTCLLPSRRAKFYHIWGHVSGIGLLYVITVLFANQGKHIITHIGRIFRICVPLLLYFIIVWSITFFTFWRIRTTSWGRTYSSYEKAVTQAFTAGSNNFELAIAVAVASFGADAPEVLAATMGPLVEVPVLLLLSYLALYLRDRLNWSTKSKTGSDL